MLILHGLVSTLSAYEVHTKCTKDDTLSSDCITIRLSDFHCFYTLQAFDDELNQFFFSDNGKYVGGRENSVLPYSWIQNKNKLISMLHAPLL